MHKFIFTFLIILTLLPFPGAATPAPANPYFSWKTQNQAQKAFAASNTVITTENCVFSNNNSTLRFYNGRRKAEIDDVTVWLNVAPELNKSNHQWHIATIDMDLLSLSLQSQAEKEPAPLKIVIDPGHGGSDSGAITAFKDFYEKEINLILAKQVGKILKRCGLTVIYTRKKDTTLSLAERSAIARRKKADLFVSIHANKAANTNACGMETFVLTPSGYHGTSSGSPPRGWQIGNKNDYNNNLLGYSIHKELIKLENTMDRGLKRQSFFVLRETHCPAVLIEAGFLSNKEEVARMKTSKWQAECSHKIADGIIEYCRKVNSLNKAVAAKRKSDTEANEQWQNYLAQKRDKRIKTAKVKQVDKEEIPQLAAVSEKAIQPEMATAQTQKTKYAKVNITDSKQLKEAASPDLQYISSSSIQSVATNIYLKNAESATEKKTDNAGLQTLADFYETGKVK